jgi:hypothetical protein
MHFVLKIRLNENEMQFGPFLSTTGLGSDRDIEVPLSYPGLPARFLTFTPMEDGRVLIEKLDSEMAVLCDGQALRNSQAVRLPYHLTFGDVSVEIISAPNSDEFFAPALGSRYQLQQTQPMMVAPAGLYQPEMIAPQKHASVLPLLSLIMGIIGPFPLGFSWILGIVLGFIAIKGIKKFGGASRDYRMATAGIMFGFGWMIILSIAAGWYGTVNYLQKQETQRERERAAIERQIKVNEGKAIEVLQGIARAQRYSKGILVADENQNEIGEYLYFDQLVPNRLQYFPAEIQQSAFSGYVFEIKNVTEENFLAIGSPEKYGTSGRLIFSIGPAGTINGADLGGRIYAEMPEKLTQLDGFENAYIDYQEEIAGNIFKKAKMLTMEKDPSKYERSRLLLDVLRENYANTKWGREAQEGLAPTVDKVLLDYRASKLKQESDEALAADNLELAIGKLDELTKKYADYKNIAAVNAQLETLSNQLQSKKEDEANALMKQSIELEKAGNLEEVEKIFKKIELLYPTTEAAQKVTNMQGSLRDNKTEQEAESAFEELMELSVTDNSHAILAMVAQMRMRFANSYIVKRNSDIILEKERKALAAKYTNEATELAKDGKIQSAVARMEDAVAENPGILDDVRVLYSDLLIKVGNLFLKQGSPEYALAYFDRYLELNPNGDLIDPQLVQDTHWKLIRPALQKKDYGTMLTHLLKCEKSRSNTAEYQMYLGRVRFTQQDWKAAGKAFSNHITLEPNQMKAYYYRAYIAARMSLDHQIDIASSFEISIPDIVSTNSDESLLLDEPEQTEAPAAKDTNRPSTNITTNTEITSGEDTGIFNRTRDAQENVSLKMYKEDELNYNHKDAMDFMVELFGILESLDGLSPTADSDDSQQNGFMVNPSSTTVKQTFLLTSEISKYRRMHIELKRKHAKMINKLEMSTALMKMAIRDLRFIEQRAGDNSKTAKEMRQFCEKNLAYMLDIDGEVEKTLTDLNNTIDGIMKIIERKLESEKSRTKEFDSSASKAQDLLNFRMTNFKKFDLAIVKLQDALEVKIPWDDYTEVFLED